MKTNELTGKALDWAVCVAVYGYGADYKTNRYSTDWSFGGPIIEREMIDLQPVMRLHTKDVYWRACGAFMSPTPLIAAMRCFCCAKLGDEIDIPEELCQQQNS